MPKTIVLDAIASVRTAPVQEDDAMAVIVQTRSHGSKNMGRASHPPIERRAPG
jgi:hypothetical protein